LTFACAYVTLAGMQDREILPADSAEIRSGSFGRRAAMRDYRAEWIGQVLVERVIWGQLPAPRLMAGNVIAHTNYVWFRFWLAEYDQVVERYYRPDGILIGTQIEVCMPLICDENGCRTTSLLLQIWIDPQGQVTVHNEDRFEDAIRQDRLAEDEIWYAENHLRHLTGTIARGKFPPPLVRNWQIDPQRIPED
jgi:predicted RNA-binding protein associated with RNAse of E/G family